MAANGRRLTGPDPETVVEAVGQAAGTLEVAFNDHAVTIAQAIRDAAPRAAGEAIERGLNEVAAAINDLANAIREGNARR